MQGNLILHYDFSTVHSTIIGDSTNSGAAGVIRNYDALGATIAKDSIYGMPMNIISLPGYELGGYIQLPDGILKDTKGFTISTWCKVHSARNIHSIFSFGKNSSIYLDIIKSELSNKVFLRPCVTSGGRSQEWSTRENISIDLNRWYLLTLSLTDGVKPNLLTLYIDGIKIATISQTRLSASELNNSTCNYIGMSTLANEPAHCSIADFAIYNKALSDEDISLLFNISDEERLLADLNQIIIDNKLPASTLIDDRLPHSSNINCIENSLTLPNIGPYGSTFLWESSEPSILSNDGVIKRPSSYVGNKRVDLKVSAIYGNKNIARTYPLLIMAYPKDEQLVVAALEQLKLPSLSAVYEDLNLPSKGEYETSINYESDCPKYIDNIGHVKRPSIGEEIAIVNLTVTATLNNCSHSIVKTVRILPHFELPKILSVSPIIVTTYIGVNPLLPSRVKVLYSNNIYGDEYITWDTNEHSYNSIGTYKVNGIIHEYDYKVTATIHVKYVNISSLGTTLPLEAVSLLGDHIFTQNYKRSLEYLIMLDKDRMLYNFRMTFGVNTKDAKPLGGWDEPTGLLRGHSTGHYLSALSLAYSSSKNTEIKEKLDYIVDVLYELQQLSKGRPEDFTTACTPTSATQQNWSTNPNTWGVGYISAYSPDQFALLEQFTPYATIWAPYYTLHKLLAGFIDCYTYTNNTKALAIAEGIGYWTYHRLNSLSKETRDKMWSMYIAGEYGGMNESLARLYVLTKKDIYIDAAKMFDNPKIFKGLSIGQDVISGIHANQHIPQIIGAMWEYKATSESYYYHLAKSFFDIVINHYMYSIGGVGRGENFKEPDRLANNIELDRNCETCAAYNMLKLTKDLYAYAPDEVYYMDYYERTLINHIVPSQNPIIAEGMHHGVTYMLPIGPGQRRGYSSDYHDFTCCHGTGMENHVKYQEMTYFLDHENTTITVNLYLPSTFNWREKGVTITQEQSFPSETSRITIEGSSEFSIRLRIPQWITKDAAIFINGESYSKELTPSSYVTLTRNWSHGDVLELYTPYAVYLDKTMDTLDSSMVASIMYGPFVMVAKDKRKDFITLVLSPSLEKDFKNTSTSLSDIRLHYDTLEFIPMYKAYDTEYHTYFKIVIPN